MSHTPGAPTLLRQVVWEHRRRYPLISDQLADFAAVAQARGYGRERAPESRPQKCSLAGKRARLGHGGLSLAAVEGKAYVKWADRFTKLLRGENVPAWDQAQKSADPVKYLHSMLGAARANTVGARVRDWERFRRWLVLRSGSTWPSEARYLIEYLWVQMEERPSPTFPRKWRATTGWMEERAGIPEELRLSGDPGFRMCVEKATAEAEEGTGDRYQAPRFPVFVLVALERAVVDESSPPCHSCVLLGPPVEGVRSYALR